MNDADRQRLNDAIRDVPDFPKPGINFKDITPVLGDGELFRLAVDGLIEVAGGEPIDKIVGIDARGFILGGAVAHQLSVGFVPLRKTGKLPAETHGVEYALEYGFDKLEIHVDALEPGEKVLLVDDLIATGGTAEAAVKLIRQCGAELIAACFVIDLPDLGGAAKLEALGCPVRALCAYEGH